MQVEKNTNYYCPKRIIAFYLLCVKWKAVRSRYEDNELGQLTFQIRCHRQPLFSFLFYPEMMLSCNFMDWTQLALNLATLLNRSDNTFKSFS